jgi:epoxyqueuosine reductase
MMRPSVRCLPRARNSGEAGLGGEAERLLDDPSPLVRGAAIWALGRLDPVRLERRAATRRDGESNPDVMAEWTASGRG